GGGPRVVSGGERGLGAAPRPPGGPATMAAWLAAGQAAKDALRDAATTARILAGGEPTDGLELLAPVPRPGKVVAIGRNYRAHTDEEGVEPPASPLVFGRGPAPVVG